jgi:hypothetical protein
MWRVCGGDYACSKTVEVRMREGSMSLASLVAGETWGYLYWGMAWGVAAIRALKIFVGPDDDGSCLSHVA